MGGRLISLPWVARIPAAALQHGGGRVYRVGQTGEDTTDCSRLTYATLCALYGASVGAERAALMVYDPAHPWSPIEAAERLGVGREVPAPVMGAWHLAQGWVSLDPLRGGHSLLWYEPASPIANGEGVCVQANAGLGAFCTTGQTWSERVARYAGGVRLAKLIEV